MKKFVIIVAVIFMATAIVKAQDSGNPEPAKENEVKAEEAQQDATVEEKAQEAVNEVEAQKEETKAIAEEKAKEAEKQVEAKAQPKQGKEGYLADLSSSDENKIVAAAEWLGEKEEKAAVPGLVNLLKNDKRAKVRVHASVALGLIADESSIPALNEALTGDSNADVRYSVLLAIHRINPAKSLDAIQKAKETESDPYIKDYLDKMEAKWKEKK